ncbi:MAG: hypothetical protein NT120_01500 [Candidatus Aenigmarchaeota archaeon]|nr:hypothetical protein [Candidatus Aenigmarchaeota archaeon]
MKGQYKLIFEVLLILAGIVMTGFVIANFQGMQKAATSIALRDSFNTVANNVIIAVIKASNEENSIIRLDIPDQISSNVYKIGMEGDLLTVSSVNNPEINITRQIFNIGQPNRISKSEVISSAGNIEVVTENGRIRLRRGLSPDLCVILGLGC